MSSKGTDLRGYLASVETETYCIHKAVNVESEIAALCSEATHPIVFDKLTGFDGWRLADRLIGDRGLQGQVLGCSPRSVIQTYAGRTAAGPGPTELHADGPVRERIWTGDDANLYRLPVPVPSEGIEVPYLDLHPEAFRAPVISGSIAVTKNPATGLQNCFFTMAKVVGEQRAHCYIFSPHTWQNIAAYGERGERAPMALVIGCHPAFELAAAYTGPHPGYSELDIAATLIGEPVPLVRCETVDLQIPAAAEVVIEGFIDPEPSRYIHTSAHSDTHTPFISQEPFFDVTAITMRNDPIYRHIQPTRFTDHHAICEFIIAPMLYNVLQAKGLNVHDVAVPMRSALNCGAIQMTAGVREEVVEAVYAGMTNPFFPRLTVAVDEDIDIYDTADLLYALSIRVDATADIYTLANVRSFNLEPQSREIAGLPGGLLRSGARYGIDATKPPLSEPERRVHFERLTARGERRVRLADFLSD